MIADIHIGNNLYGALAYNQEKIDAGQGKVLEANRIFVPADGRFSIGNCVRDFELTIPSQVTTKRGIIHISLNPHPDDKLTDQQLADIGREYIERMGLGRQPWMIFKHEDIDREHLHIVSTRVRGDGTLISDKNNYEKSRKITDDLERKYSLHLKEKRRGEVWRLAPVDAAAGNLKKQVANIIKSLSETYNFHSFGEYRALLSLYNIGVEKIEGDNKGHRYRGLVYSALDTDGNRAGKPLKSSLFGKKYGIGALEQAMQKAKETIKTNGQVAVIKALVSAAMTGSGTVGATSGAKDVEIITNSGATVAGTATDFRTRDAVAGSISKARAGSKFRAALRERGIDLVLRRNDAGRIYGATFIDHNSRTVMNGSALGKEFSANALSARFPDFSTAPHENLKPVAPVTEILQPTISVPDNSQPAIPAITPANETLRPTTQPARKLPDKTEPKKGRKI